MTTSGPRHISTITARKSRSSYPSQHKTLCPSRDPKIAWQDQSRCRDGNCEFSERGLLAYLIRNVETFRHDRAQKRSGGPTVLACSHAAFTWTTICGSPNTRESRPQVNTENMDQSRFVQQPVEVLPFAQLQSVLAPQKMEKRIRRQRRFAGPYQEFGAAAGGKNDYFFNAFSTLELLQHFVTPVFADPETFSHGQRSGPVVQADHHERGFHDEDLECKLHFGKRKPVAKAVLLRSALKQRIFRDLRWSRQMRCS